VVVVSAIVATAAGWVLVGESSGSDVPGLRLFVTAVLGIPFFFAIETMGERQGWSRTRTAIVELVGLLALLAFYLAWPSWSEEHSWTRWFQLIVGLHLLVAVLPYAFVGELNGFWQYNRSLLLRFLIAAFFSVVLFAGLAGALAAIDNLLGVDVEDETYGRLWFLIAFTFNTWYFVAGIPRDLAALDRDADYPLLVKVFAQYILLPIVAVYLAILTIYLGKVIVTREWPSGWIGYLVSGVSAAGILTLLLVHPIRDREENRWVNTYARWFFIALIPAIIMLFLAVGKRIDQYGITERRYFLLVLTIWIAATAVYYSIVRSRNIKLIPGTLCVIAFATFLGPWSAYSVSLASQIGRLEGLLTGNGLLEEGVARPAASPVSAEDRREISAILLYLLKTHGTTGIEAWFSDPPLARIDSLGMEPTSDHQEAEQRARVISASLGIEYVWERERESPDRFDFSAAGEPVAVPIGAYDYAITGVAVLDGTYSIQGSTLVLRYVEETNSVEVVLGEQVLAELSLARLLAGLRAYRAEGGNVWSVPRELMALEAHHEDADVLLRIERVSGGGPEGAERFDSAFGDLYLRFADSLRVRVTGESEGNAGRDTTP
jgi:hypothetical protein